MEGGVGGVVWEVDMQVPKNLHILGPVGPRKFWVFWLPIHRCQRASEYLNGTASLPVFGSTFAIFRLRRAMNLTYYHLCDRIQAL